MVDAVVVQKCLDNPAVQPALKGSSVLRRVIATIFVCYGLLYAIPIVFVLGDDGSWREQLLTWTAAGILLAPGAAFVIAGVGVLSSAGWWRFLAVGAAAASSALTLVGFPIPTVFLMLNLAVIAGALRFWVRRRLLRLRAG
jgi:hypothetical protein